MSGHTPGPWAWDESGHVLRPVNPDPDASAVHTILSPDGAYGFVGSDLSVTRSETETNQRLIAASPDLFQALESVWLWMEKQADGQSKGGHATFDLMMLREQRDIAHAAILKALGGAA